MFASLSPEWQALPLNGYTRIFENMLLNDPNITIRLGVDFFASREAGLLPECASPPPRPAPPPHPAPSPPGPLAPGPRAPRAPRPHRLSQPAGSLAATARTPELGGGCASGCASGRS